VARHRAHPPTPDLDERISLHPLDPEDVLRSLLKKGKKVKGKGESKPEDESSD
jgi:hypothetical protein